MTEYMSLEELWIQLQIRGIKTIKLYQNPNLSYSKMFADKNISVWQNLITRQHDGYDFTKRSEYAIFTLEIDKIENFRPLKVKGFDSTSWYYLSMNRNISGCSLQLWYKSDILLKREFNSIDKLSGDSLLNW